MIKVLIGVYFIAMNVYSFLLLKSQRDSYDEGECENAVHDGKLFIAAILGGATGIFAGIFALKYRMRSMFLMVLMPVIIVINWYLVFVGLTSSYGLYAARGYEIFLNGINRP